MTGAYFDKIRHGRFANLQAVELSCRAARCKPTTVRPMVRLWHDAGDGVQPALGTLRGHGAQQPLCVGVQRLVEYPGDL